MRVFARDRITRNGLLVLVFTGLMVMPAAADEVSPDPGFVHWHAPAHGSPAVRYEVQIQDLDGTFDVIVTVDAMPGTEQTYPFEPVIYMHRYRARVAAIDAQDRQGLWSEWSPFYDRDLPAPQP